MTGYMIGLIGLAGAHTDGGHDWTDYAFSGVGFAVAVGVAIWQIRRYTRQARREPYLA